MYTSAIVLIAHPVPRARRAKKHTKSFPASVRGAAPSP